MQTVSNKDYGVYWLLVVLLLLSVLFYHNTILLPPSYIHSWTQSDRYALSLGFLENGFNFLKPQTFNLATTNGITGVDFPLQEYIVALLMKLLGTTNPLIFRLYNLLIAIIGSCYVYKLFKIFTTSNFISIIGSVFVFTLPIVTYYQAGFLPSSTSFYLTIIGYYFYFSYTKNNKIRYFNMALFFITIAALCRTPFVIYLVAVLVQVIYGATKSKKFFIKHFVYLTIAFVIVILWALYKNYLNKMYGSQFLTTLRPADSFTELFHTTISVLYRWCFQTFTIFHITMLALLFYFFKLYKNKKGNLLSLLAIITLIGFIIYYILMAQQFIDHEYYLLDCFYIPIILLLIYWSTYIPKRPQVKAISILLIAGCVTMSYNVQLTKYSPTNWDKAEIARKNFVDGDIILDKLGVKKEDIILVLDAYSTNAPLIQLKRKGYTLIKAGYKNIAPVFNLPYDYMVVQNIFLPSEIIYNYPTFLSKVVRVGGNENFSVFKRNALIKDTLPIEDALGIAAIDTVYKFEIGKIIDTTIWQNINIVMDKLTNSNVGLLSSSQEFGPTVTTSNTYTKKRLLLKAIIKLQENNKEFKFVTTIEDKQGKLIYYRDYALINNEQKDFFKYYCLFDIPEKLVGKLKCYIWNENKIEIEYKKMELLFY